MPDTRFLLLFTGLIPGTTNTELTSNPKVSGWVWLSDVLSVEDVVAWSRSLHNIHSFAFWSFLVIRTCSTWELHVSPLRAACNWFTVCKTIVFRFPILCNRWSRQTYLHKLSPYSLPSEWFTIQYSCFYLHGKKNLEMFDVLDFPMLLYYNHKYTSHCTNLALNSKWESFGFFKVKWNKVQWKNIGFFGHLFIMAFPPHHS